MRFFLTLIILMISVTSWAQLTSRTTTVNGATVRIHLVQKGETLFALSRQYDVPPSQLIKLNPQAEKGLNIGQEFYLPAKEATTTTPTAAANGSHTVQKGETLFAIARKYQVGVDEIKSLNKLTSDGLSEGQVLKIPGKSAGNTAGNKTETVVKQPSNSETYTVEAGETLYALSKKFNVSVDDIMKWNNLTSTSLSEGQQLIIKQEGSPSIEKEEVQTTDKTEAIKEKEEKKEVKKEVKAEEKSKQITQNSDKDDEVQTNTTPMPTDKFVEVTEQGVAELIPDTENTRKYLAVHRTIKPGTIIRVRNEMNGREVWARVIGPLPDTNENKDILVKISKAAFDRLGAVDKRFRVTITYIP